MRAIFLCPNVPYPPQNGGHHRNLGLIRALSRFAEVHVLAVGDPRGARVGEAQAVLSAWGSRLEVHSPTGPGRPEEDEENTGRAPDAFAHFRAPGLSAALARCVETTRFDFAHVEEVVMTQYLGPLPRPRVLDRQKIDWAYHEAMAGIVGRGEIVHVREAARFRWWESTLRGAFDRVLVPGLGDQQLLEPIHGPGLVSVVPIGIDDGLQPPTAPGRGVAHVLLYGALDYGPNVEAQRWFFEEVWPALRKAAPGLGAVIVGSGRPPLRAAPPPSDGVEVRGFVPEIRGVLQAPGVLVVPVRVGGGARTKILEALACGMPVVSTGIGVENLGLVPGRDFLLAETAAETVGAILRLVGDPGLVAALGREGAARADAFRWSRIEAQVEGIYREVVAASGSADAPRWAPTAALSGVEADVESGRRAGFRRAEAMVNRVLDRLLTPGGGTGLGSRVRRGLARLLRRACRLGWLLVGASLLPGGIHAAQEASPAGSAAGSLATEWLATSDEAARTRLLREHPDVSAAALGTALVERGKTLFKSGETDTALLAFEATVALAEASDLKPQLGEALYRIGIARDHRGEFARAAEALDRAEALGRELGDDRLQAGIWNHRGLQARLLAEFDEAEGYFRRSLEVFLARGEKERSSAVLGNLGLVCQNRGDYACALDAQQRALELDPRNTYAMYNIAVIHENQGDAALALDDCLRAAAIDHEDGDAVHEAVQLVQAGRLQSGLGDEPRALGLFATARAVLEKAQDPAQLGELEYALGELHLHAGRAGDATRHFGAAVALQEKVDLPLLSDSLKGLSRAQLAARQPAAALASARRTLEIGTRLDSLSIASGAWEAIGEAQEALLETEQARAAYTEAVALIESWREHLAGDETSHQRFFEGLLKPYHRLLRLAVAARRQDEALRLAEQARARVLVDVLQHGRHIGMRLLTPEEREREAAAEAAVRTLEVRRDAVSDPRSPARAEIGTRLESARRELAATRTALLNAHAALRLARGEAEIVTSGGLAPLLADGSAALAFTVTEEATYAFAFTAASGDPSARVHVGIATLPTGAKAWRSRVGAFRGSLAHRDLDVAPEAQALFADLLGPVQGEIKGRKRLYVVPDGALWEIPFAALQPSAGRYLIEETALVIAPSLTALVAWRARPPSPRREGGGYELLGVGPTEFGPSLQRLTETARQTRAVAALYGPSSHVLLGREATEARVKAEMGRARVLHFTTHGTFEPASSLYSALLLAPEPSGSSENGRLEAREILDLELPADLAVLSACETARGRIGAGEGMIGLSWALSVAGVRNTVVSLWKVDAASTTDLMLAFHRRAQAGQGYAEALRAAALTLLRAPRTRHPFYWAPFVLVGDGRGAGRPGSMSEATLPVAFGP